nr:PREDICTED: uncharacterized protein LOC100881022 [Megachile rotundata]
MTTNTVFRKQDLIEKLNRNLFMPANTEEMEIRIKFNRIIDLTTKAYTIIIAIFATGVFVMTFIVDYKGRKLVGRLWLPYDYTSTTLYVLTSVCEFLATAFGVSVNIACECLYAGLTLHICCQFEILEHRFKTLDGKDICAVNRCASHHHHIYEYAKMINNEFKKIVSCQFFMSMSVLCLNLFRMLIAQNFLDFVEVVMYMVCMFSQIFYYCFHGNLVKAKSIDFSDEIFGSDWPSWNDNSKKVLLMVIRRSKRPIEFTSMHVVTLSLESFMSLNRNLFMPANKQEMDIRMKFNRIIELTTKAYTVVIAIFASGMFLITIVVDFKGRKLVGRVWLPYDYSSTTLYLITSISQFLAAIFGVSINIACECLYAGLTLHVCCQFEILEHRFKTLDGKDICAVNRCASHHHHIYEYATMINNEFKKIMSCQFFMSISVLCLNLFRMLIAQNFSDFVEAVMYMVCMFSQIFYYCFHGNMVKTKSIDFSDEIFGSDWPSWNDNSKKVLLMVIRRSKTPIEFTSMHVVSLNLESFMSVLFNIEDRGFSLKRMHKFPLSFTLLTCCGYWRPTKWPTNSFKYWLYNIYSVFMIGFIWFFAFYAMVDSVTSKDLTTMSDKLSVGLSVLRVCVQVPILFIQRNKIISVVHILLEDDCIPRDEEEVIIKRKCDSLASWMPFSLDRIELYMVSLLHQTCGLFICANTSVAIETMVAGLLMQARGQFEMFCHRARNVPVALMAIERDDNSGKNLGRKWRKMRKDLVRYHLHIINFVNSINSAFQYIIAIQFLISSSVLCLSVYQMSLLDLFTVDMLFSYSYVGSMFTQVYLYCWFGNEMTLKSTELADAIYGMDWTILPTDVQKDLLIIMIRSMKPVKITCAHILILSVDSFVSIIKISYSTYNLLKTTDGT